MKFLFSVWVGTFCLNGATPCPDPTPLPIQMLTALQRVNNSNCGRDYQQEMTGSAKFNADRTVTTENGPKTTTYTVDVTGNLLLQGGPKEASLQIATTLLAINPANADNNARREVEKFNGKRSYGFFKR